MSWISCKCLLTFCEVSPLYLQRDCFAAVQRKGFCIIVAGQQNKSVTFENNAHFGKSAALL